MRPRAASASPTTPWRHGRSPPRQLELEVSRYRLLDVPIGGGRGVVLHASYSVLSAYDDEP